MNRAFDVAWFFHVSPAAVLALEVDDFLAWEAQAFRIADMRQRAASRESL